MISDYDENLRENPFYQKLITTHYDEIQDCTKDLVLCIPKLSFLERNTIPDAEYLDHILVANSQDSYLSLNNNLISIINEEIVLGTRKVKILFTETFYEQHNLKYKVLCLETSLGKSEKQNYNRNALLTARDCIDFLWDEESQLNVVKKINLQVKEFFERNTEILELKTLSCLKEIFQNLYEECLHVSTNILASNSKFQKDKTYINVAIETCMQYCCENRLFDVVSTCETAKDTILNKIIRNLQDLQLKDFNIPSSFYDHLILVKFELSKINKYVTVLEKINCLKSTFSLLSKSKTNVTASDFLHVLIYLLVKLHVNNWYANLSFLTNFHFSTDEESSEYSFLIASLEAAIEYIKNGQCQMLLLHQEEKIENNSLQNLFEQIRLNNLDEIKQILLKSNKKSDYLLDLCHPLCSCDHCEVIIRKNKSNNNCSVSSTDDTGRNALHIACITGNPLVVEYLLQKTSNIDVTDYFGLTPALYASSKGHQHALLLLLHANSDINTTDNEGNTMLHLAANNGHENCVKAILYFSELTQSLLINTSNNFGETPLHLASKWGYIVIVANLLQHNASVLAQSRKKLTAIDVAHNYFVKNLLEHYEQMEKSPEKNEVSEVILKPVIAVASKNRPVVLEQTVPDASSPKKYGVRPKNLEQYKKTDLLLLAVEKNDMPLTCYYLGIPNPNQNQLPPASNLSKTCHPLCICKSCNDANTSTTLDNPNRHNSLNINICNLDGLTALHVAGKFGRREILRLLLDAGADVNIVTNTTGATVLHLAARYDRIAVIRELVQCGGCQINAKDDEGFTALYYACLGGSARVIEVLLSEGADLSVVNNEGKMVEEVVSGKVDWGILKLLRRRLD